MRSPLLQALLPAFLFAALLCPGALRAQRIAVYATFDVTHLSNVPTGYPQTSAPFQEQFTSITPVGIAGGISYRVLALPRAAVSVDIRGATHDGINGQDNGLFGMKFALTKPVHRIKPYVEGAAGFLSSRTRNISSTASGFYKFDQTFTAHYAVYEFLGGLDYPLKGHLDVRLIEVGGGSSFNASPSTSLFTVNSGFVLHF